MKWKKTETIILCLLGIVVIISVVALGSIMSEYAKGKAAYRELEGYVFLPEEQEGVPEKDSGQPQQNAIASDSEDDKTEDKAIVYYGQSPQVNFEALQTQNSDVVGWIYAAGTPINYPVVQGTDNEYYLTHLFSGEENKCGSIFLDSLNEKDFSNSNSILHGHHMKNGSMFASLMNYESQSYYDSHPVMWLVTPEQTYQMEIFSGFVSSTDSEVWQLEFATKEEYQSWLDKMIKKSAFESNVKPDSDDKILTLSTCSYEYDDARFVVMGILRSEF